MADPCTPSTAAGSSTGLPPLPPGERSSAGGTLPRAHRHHNHIHHHHAAVSATYRVDAASRPSRSFIRACHKAKRVRFYRNGDMYFKGVFYAISSERFRTFESLLEDLTRCLNDLIALPHGVRTIYTLDGGDKIASIAELKDGHSYVCASNDAYKGDAELYLNAKEPVWRSAAAGGKAKGVAAFAQQAEDVVDAPVAATSAARDFVYPRIITVIRNGVKPRRIVRLLLNRRTAHTFEQVLNDITVAVKLDSGVVRKILTFRGNPVVNLEDFFLEDDVFIAYGSEASSNDDFYVDSEEYKFMCSPRFRPASLAGERGGHSNARLVRKYLITGGACDGRSMIRRRFLNRRNQVIKRPEGDETIDQPSHVVMTSPRPAAEQEVEVVHSDSDDHDSAIDSDSAEDTAPDEVEPVQPTPGHAAVPNGVPGLHSSSSSSGDEDDEHPTHIAERYKIGRIIGDGNFAVVYETFDLHRNTEVALKVIDKEKCIGKEDMVANEIDVLRQLEHEHIVQLFDDHATQHRYYLAMELVHGGDLFDALVEARSYTEPVAAQLMRSLVEAIHYLHERSIVHRDVKPENLLMYTTPDGTPAIKLADFGLACIVAPSESLFTVCGTPTYVAPEILEEVGYSLQVDIWAAGVILYITLCGFPPFVSLSNDQEELFDAILSGHFTFPSPYWDHISRHVKLLIESMLQLDVNRRLTAAQVLSYDWIQYSGELPSTPLPVFDQYQPDVETSFTEGQQPQDPTSAPLDESHDLDFMRRRRSMDELSTVSSQLQN